MDFTEAAEYKFLCPVLLMELEGQKSESKVERWGKREPRVLGRDIRRIDSQNRCNEEYPHNTSTFRQQQHQSSGLTSTVASSGSIEQEIPYSRYCVNQLRHHSCGDKCGNQRLKIDSQQQSDNQFVNKELSRLFSRNTAGNKGQSSILIDRVTLTQPARETRELLYNVQDMLMSSPKFEPMFHVEDIDLTHCDPMTFDGFVLSAALDHLDPTYYRFYYSEHEAKSEHRLKQNKVWGNLRSSSSLRHNYGADRDCRSGSFIRNRRLQGFSSSPQLGTPFNTGGIASTVNGINNGNKVDHPSGLVGDISVVHFDHNNAKICGTLMKSARATAMFQTVNGSPKSQTPLFQSSNTHNTISNLAVVEDSQFIADRNLTINGSTTIGDHTVDAVCPVRTLRHQPSPETMKNPMRPNHHSVCPPSLLTTGLARLRFVPSDLNAGILEGHGALLPKNDDLRDLPTEKTRCPRPNQMDGEVQIRNPKSINELNLRILVTDCSGFCMRVPITPEMTCNKAINLIVDKMTEREREQLRMDCNSDFELRHLNDDDVDFHQPPIDPTMHLAAGGIRGVALCRKLAVENSLAKNDEYGHHGKKGEISGLVQIDRLKNHYRARLPADRRVSLTDHSRMSHFSETKSHQCHYKNDNEVQRYSKRRSSFPRDCDDFFWKAFTNRNLSPEGQGATGISQGLTNDDARIVGSLLMVNEGEILGVPIGREGIPFEVSQESLSDFSPGDTQPSRLKSTMPKVSLPGLPPLSSSMANRFTGCHSPVPAKVSCGGLTSEVSLRCYFDEVSSCPTATACFPGKYLSRSSFPSNSIQQPPIHKDPNEALHRPRTDSFPHCRTSGKLDRPASFELAKAHLSVGVEAPPDVLVKSTLPDVVCLNRLNFSGVTRLDSPPPKSPSSTECVLPRNPSSNCINETFTLDCRLARRSSLTNHSTTEKSETTRNTKRSQSVEIDSTKMFPNVRRKSQQQFSPLRKIDGSNGAIRSRSSRVELKRHGHISGSRKSGPFLSVEGNISHGPRSTNPLSDQLSTTSSKNYQISGLFEDRNDPSIFCNLSRWKSYNSIEIPTRLFIILSMRAAAEINDFVDIESGDVLRVCSQLMNLGHDRSDIGVIGVPGDSRVFELLSYLLKTDNNAYILGHDSPNPGTLFFESFFSGCRVETDVLVNTLGTINSSLVLMRKKTRTTDNKRQSSSSLISPCFSGFGRDTKGELVSFRPPLDLFEFDESRTNQPVTYRCSVAVTGIGGTLIPKDKRRFHTCQIVVDGRRIFHSFLQTTPWDDESSVGEVNDAECITETEELDRAYTKAKNERIKIFNSSIQKTHSTQSNSNQASNVIANPNNSQLMTQPNVLSVGRTASPKVVTSPKSVSSPSSSPGSILGLNLADLFIPSHLSIENILTVKPDPCIASQLEVAYLFPRPFGFLGALPEDKEEEIMFRKQQTEITCKSSTLSFEDVINAYASNVSGRDVNDSSTTTHQEGQQSGISTSNIPPLLQSAIQSSRTSSISDLGHPNSIARPISMVNVRVTYVAVSPHICAELAARFRFLAKLK